MKKDYLTENKYYCIYEDVHTGCYDCHVCSEGYICLGNECVYRDTMWRIRVNVYRSHLDWDMGTNKVASFDYLTLGNKLPEKAEDIIRRIKKMYSGDVWCDYTLKLIPHGLRLRRVVDNLVTELVKQWAYDEYDIDLTSVGYVDNGRGFSKEVYDRYVTEARELLFKNAIEDVIKLKEEVEF